MPLPAECGLYQNQHELKPMKIKAIATLRFDQQGSHFKNQRDRGFKI